MDIHPGGAPVASTPVRRPRSIRRTTTHDCTRPEGFDGPVKLVASGRDLLTTQDGEAVTVDAARIDASVRYLEGTILSFALTPPEPALDSLAGKKAYAGFRRLVEEALPGEVTSHSVRFQLLDEMPAAILASGRALRMAGIRISMGGSAPLGVDRCAGWAEGGTLLAGYSELGPPLDIGPLAPRVEPGDDPLAWHDIDPLPAHGTRRRRRFDLWEEGGKAWADCFFRDSHVDQDGVETIVHEWSLTAEIDRRERRFVHAAATSGPLPYPECPASGGSATRLAGTPIDGLRRNVRTNFVGTSTCTHLNDTFRALEDAGALLDLLPGRM
jgi:hypothetical protein